MGKIINALLFFSFSFVYSQTDYSNSWVDFYSYNNVKDFLIVDDVIYALCDNSIFTYDIVTEETEKLSSINGLSGEETSSIFYSESTNRLIIGYDSGLLEIVDQNDAITIAPDIVNFNQTGLKSINHIYEYNSKLYLSTAFAVIVYDIENLEFGDTYFIGAGSTDVFANEITVLNDEIYVATNSGIYVADVNNNSLIDASNWEQRFTGAYQNIVTFNNQVYAVSNNLLYVLNGSTLQQQLSFSENITDVKSDNSNISIALESETRTYNSSFVELNVNPVITDFDYIVNSSVYYDDNLYIATTTNGILSSSSEDETYNEIHPEGPLSNEVFSLDVHNGNLWVVYGGYNSVYGPSQNRQGFSHFNGEKWTSTPYDSEDPFADLVSVTIDRNSENRVYISSFGGTNIVNESTYLSGGLFEIENNEIKSFYNHTNSPLERVVVESAPNYITVRISESVFDDEGNLWLTNAEVDYKIKRLSPDGTWTSYDINDLYVNNSAGMNDIVIDNIGTKWIGTRGNGVYAFNENGDRKVGLTTTVNEGSLPNIKVESVAVDENNNIWIGTLTGLVVFYNAQNIFDSSIYNAEPVIIEENGIAERLLGEQAVISIAVDGANNKWFGTDDGGVLNTNSTGKTTLASFNTSNSPLPSNQILDIVIDDSTGLVYFATGKGIVAYDSNVSPYGDILGEVYAYPNPVLKNHDTVTIDGRNGTHLPENTNVKILDASGNLVYETNVLEGQELNGGKVVWDKRNLAGNKVASGIYVVLLASEDGTESQFTKIAIVN